MKTTIDPGELGKTFLQNVKKMPTDKSVVKDFLAKDFKDANFSKVVSELVPTFRANGNFMVWILDQVKKGNAEESLKVWNKIVMSLGKTLHQSGEGTSMLNSLLQVVEKSFKHEDDSMKVHAYEAWMVLMDNFALNPQMIVGSKRITLLIKPLTVSPFNS